ncbi:MAG: hypothetical protein EOP24_32335 [Hyphomicrobiales bacterium]|nr:MAG: hypothetical protein EOP24_32335 [Hyphomicrobiales bacterium]
MVRSADEIPDLVDVCPEALMADPARLWASGLCSIAARALAYAHATGARGYDELGFRWSAALPTRDVAPLQTIHRAALRHARKLTRREDPRVEQARAEQMRLRHRPLDVPRDGHYRYEHDGELLHLTRCWTDHRGRPQEDVWTFPLTAPPSMYADKAEDHDEPALLGHLIQVEVPGMRWLPLRTVIQAGAFPRMQGCRAALTSKIEPDCFYAFLSHRWLARAEPDPDGGQARYAAWQLVGHLCDALRVAGQRGLHAPRRFNATAGFVVGIAGSELAEALLVNLLRPVLAEATLALALQEIAPLERELADRGVRLAAEREGFARLRALLADRPVLASLVERIYVWYDFSCLPQAPRDEADEELFGAGLQHLVAFQMLGRTVVLLDETEDYLSRGWCTLEAIVADSQMGHLDLFVGSQRPTAAKGRTEHYFETLLQDRPHMVWRALLDTDVLHVQSPAECMSRLGLALTDEADVPIVYDRLRTIRAPAKVHTDASELWTGVIPVPVTDGGAAAVVPRSGTRVLREQPSAPARGLNWTGALRLGAQDHTPAPAFLKLRSVGCHVAVLASCEGEAVYFTRWVLRHCNQLGTPVASVSWLAADIAPVGAMPCGSLRAQPVDAPSWVLVGTSMRLEHGHAGPAIVAALTAAGTPYLLLEIDREDANLVRVDPRPDSGDTETVSIPAGGFPVHAGGLLRAFALKELV